MTVRKMSRNLFGRVCSIEIQDKFTREAKIYDAPPFTIDFETDFGGNNQTIAKLYNPNEKTIKSIQGTKKGGITIYPTVIIIAGYGGENGVVATGEIFDTKFVKSGVDRILEMKIKENVSAIASAFVLKSYRNMPANAIILDLIKVAGFKPEKKIVLGKPKTYSSFVAQDFRSALVSIATDTNSEYYFSGERVGFRPIEQPPKPSIILLDETSGLIGSPEKSNNKWKIKSLFRHKITKGIRVAVKSEMLESDILVEKGKHKFTSKGNDCYTEFEGKAVK